MKRREFITLLGGAAAAWPITAPAQQSERMRRIGVLMSTVESDPRGLEYITAFAQGLAELGWAVGRNVRIEYRWGAGDLDRFRRYAAELVALSPDVVLATAGSIVGAQCALCHGAYLTGLGPLPSIAGRSPSYMFRQLYDFQHGARAGGWSPLMAQAVANLDEQDLLAIVAYLSSRDP
jgi:cytochrome c553